ncbi:class I SAM-dependent DNA methyltransferase [Hymenobacter sp. BT770]|uniref:class I SAM-dependent DNA methyltransferase n=1 Tax=Hymenobacter sp. BT770 TaxID=2886942 RepID=UPI001D124338|nr:DNA methyltransferase [Hymenobacter sp. BT770]MCC3152776.1 class I SAM-dependent DNA methyltransferase [Hymenobacter sp. BT770]MDO3414851.1 class I SAM-dependent DNA methyltransferase [Hymenobacter sp. BT770]
MLYTDFETRWLKSGGAERANYGLFLQDFCDLLGVPRPDPTTDNPAQDAYVLERAVTFDDGGGKQTTGRIDLYKRGCFVLETKQGTTSPDEQAAAEKAQLGLPAEKRRKGHAVRGTAKWEQMMRAAQEQALRYVRALPASEPRPPFVVVVDVGHCFDVYSNFAGVGDSYVPFPDSGTYRFYLPALAKPELRAQLQQLFTDPQSLDPGRRAAQVTRQLAGHLAGLSSQLEKAGHASDVVAQFLMRCLFTMFAEDVELIPKESFSGLLTAYAGTEESRGYLPEALQSLWAVMDKGGFSPELRTRLRRFNGQLFHGATALPLNADQITLLQRAAAANWTEVEPAIFGTLLERALDPTERHSLGAHYTPRRYVERLVLPTVIEPLRREWAAAQAASATRLDEGKGKKAVTDAREELLKFLRRLTAVKVLDPACGSGNFLYVTLEHLKRLEGEVLTSLAKLGGSGRLELGDGTTVSPRQLLGLELNPRAAAIADVVLRIGYLQWHLRTHGLTELREPLLDDYQNIQQQDAVLGHKEDYSQTWPAEWPAADFIVGNPPFVGDKAMRRALGDGYVDALRKTYKGKVPESADLVMYWWHRAAQLAASGEVERFGFITTNSITQTFNRRVVQEFLGDTTNPLSLNFTIPDHPWVDAADGAAVRVAFTVAQKGVLAGSLFAVVEESTTDDDAHEVVLREMTGAINSDLTIGSDVNSAKLMEANSRLSSQGMTLVGGGFIITKPEAELLGLGRIAGLENHLRPYINGRDLAQRPRGAWVIDLFGLETNEIISKYPEVYQHVFEKVKPERELNNRATYRTKWWVFAEARSQMRKSLLGLTRYIATPRTARHRIFSFVGAEYVADAKLVAIGHDDAYFLGVLSSGIHTLWAASTGGWLGVGNDSTYNHSDCFSKFPFPAATVAQQAHIRELAEALDTHRKRQQAQHPGLALTDLYNVVEKLRAGQPLTAKEQTTHEQGLAAVVLSLHQQLDAAVAEAYGWPATLPDAEVLTRLVQLNQQRAAEEAAGTVRYLRPEYQAPGLQQGTMALATTVAAVSDVATAEAQPWPAELAQQMQALRAVVQGAAVPLTAKQAAARFRATKAARVQPLLDTLVSLALLRHVPELDAYAM